MKSISTLFLLVFFACAMQAQIHIKGRWESGDSTQIHKVVTKGGAWYKGQLLSMSDSVILLKTRSDDSLSFNFSEVDSIIFIARKISGVLSPPFPIKERLMFFPTAFGLRKGETEYLNISLFWSQVHYGLTDRITVGGGILPLLFANAAWADFKLNVELNNTVSFAIGGMIAGVYILPGGATTGSYSGGFGILTIGKPNRFFNIYVGRLAISESLEISNKSSTWLFDIGFSRKIREWLRLNLEFNNSFSNDFYSLGIGVTMLQKRAAFDFGIAIISDGSLIAPGLHISRTVRWKNKKRAIYTAPQPWNLKTPK